MNADIPHTAWIWQWMQIYHNLHESDSEWGLLIVFAFSLVSLLIYHCVYIFSWFFAVFSVFACNPLSSIIYCIHMFFCFFADLSLCLHVAIFLCWVFTIFTCSCFFVHYFLYSHVILVFFFFFFFLLIYSMFACVCFSLPVIYCAHMCFYFFYGCLLCSYVLLFLWWSFLHMLWVNSGALISSNVIVTWCHPSIGIES
jgi:hypothetical protein